jgi:hypothetical protein
MRSRHSDIHREDPYRAGNILEALFAHVVEGEVELVANFVAHYPANADAARLC